MENSNEREEFFNKIKIMVINGEKFDLNFILKNCNEINELNGTELRSFVKNIPDEFINDLYINANYFEENEAISRVFLHKCVDIRKKYLDAEPQTDEEEEYEDLMSDCEYISGIFYGLPDENEYGIMNFEINDLNENEINMILDGEMINPFVFYHLLSADLQEVSFRKFAKKLDYNTLSTQTKASVKENNEISKLIYEKKLEELTNDSERLENLNNKNNFEDDERDF